MPIDGLAFIGRNPLDHENVFIATGDSENGMTHGTIAGMLISDLILGKENEWATLYDPSRKTLRALGKFAKENINVAAQYADLVTPGEVDSLERSRLAQAGLFGADSRKLPPTKTKWERVSSSLLSVSISAAS